MAEAQLQSVPSAQTKLAVNQAIIQGKIAAKRSIKTQEGRLHLTLIKMAAADQFSHPATAELRSYNALGELNDSIQVRVKLGGVPNNYETTETDEEGNKVKKQVRSARNEYAVIED